MKRGLILVLAVLLAGFAGFSITRYQKVASQHGDGVLLDAMPELSWVKSELKLTDGQFEKVSALHVAYRPKCEEMCHSLSRAHRKVGELAAANGVMTPELEAAIREHAEVHAACQRAMLEHLYQTAALLEPAQGSRYLGIMIPQALDSANGAPGEPAHH